MAAETPISLDNVSYSFGKGALIQLLRQVGKVQRQQRAGWCRLCSRGSFGV